MNTPNNQQLYTAPIYNAGRLSQRSTKILSMFLNRLDVPDELQEFPLALYGVGNWHTTEWDEISIHRMARGLTALNPGNFHKVYNRLRKKCPEFFKWQATQYFKFVLREVIKDERRSYKTRVRYSFLIYDRITAVVAMPFESFEKDLRAKVEELMINYPSESNPPRESKLQDLESGIKRLENLLIKLAKEAGSMEAVLEEAKDSPVIQKFLQSAYQLERF